MYKSTHKRLTENYNKKMTIEKVKAGMLLTQLKLVAWPLGDVNWKILEPSQSGLDFQNTETQNGDIFVP